MTGIRRLATVSALMLVSTATAIAVSQPAFAVTTGDAYANQNANACSWTFGTAGIEKTVALSGGNYTLTSFKNKLPGTAREYVQGGVTSPEFRLSWDGAPRTGASGSWTCDSGAAATATVGGQTVIALTVQLSRSADHLRVTKRYEVFPAESIIRETTTYTNTDTAAHTLGTPSLLEQHVMGGDIAGGSVQLNYMTGAECCSSDSWTLRTTALNSSYARAFDSYDNFGCVDSGSTPAACGQRGWAETSSSYIPWFGLWNTATSDGVVASFDSFARWQAPIGSSNGAGSLSMALPTYSKSLAGSAAVTAPTATVMTYQTDLDDMTNRLLDYQYRYLWDFTRSPYFAAVRSPGDWCTGTQWCGEWDQQGVRQKVYNLADRQRAVGTDTDWRDNGWWDKPGDWNGPDFKMTEDLLAKSGQKEIIYYPAYGANTNSTVYSTNSSWFANGSPCGYTDRLGDMSIPAFESHVQSLLISNAQQWGDYEYRNDACPVANVDNATQLGEDQAWRRVLSGFLTNRTGSSYMAVDSGGNEIGLDLMRLSAGIGFTDLPGNPSIYDASRIFPADKMSGDPNVWSQNGYCTTAVWSDLSMNLSVYSSAYPQEGWHADTTDAKQLECMRQLVDTYHYLLEQGVAGRWSKQYHPNSTDGVRNWTQRTSADGSRSTVHRIGGDTAGAVTVYPKGLNAATTYDVRYQFRSGTASRTGADLMTNGIAFSGVSEGEIVYLGLAQHPGSTVDTTAPGAPTGVTATASTDVNYPGVAVTWTAGTDGNHLSYYDVSRGGVYLGRVAKGTFYLDHSPAASPYATYSVVAVDGAGNTSAAAASTPAHADNALAVDDAPGRGVTYSGFTHAYDSVGSYEGTTSSSASASDSATLAFTGASVTVYARLGRGQGSANIKIDGTTVSTVDLHSPDDLDLSVPVWSRTFATAGAHTVTFNPTGSGPVTLDGFQVVTTAPTVVESGSATTTGTWSTTCGSPCNASAGNVIASSTAGSTASYSFTSSRIRLIGKYCAACGEADVQIDGGPATRIDLWGDRGADAWQSVVYDKSFATSGAHTVKVTVTGTKNLGASGTSVVLDAFQTDPGAGGPASTSAYAAAVATDAPAAWYRMTSTADSSGHGLGGTAHGGVTFGAAGALSSEPGNGAAAFDGSTGWIDLGNPVSLQGASGAAEAWFKTTNTDSSYHAIAIKWYAYGLFVHNGHLVTYDWGTETERDTGISVADGKWHHAVLDYTSGASNGSTVYLDGTARLSTTVTVANQANDALIGAGSTDPQEQFPGSIDEVAYYGAQLPAARVAAHYAAASYAAGVNFDAPAGYWPLKTDATDASGAGNTATAAGGVTYTGTGATLNGTTGYLNAGNPSAFQSTSGTVEAWFQTTNTDASFHAVAIKWQAYGLFVRNGHLVTYDWGSSTEHDTGIAVADGNWHHAVISFQNGAPGQTLVYVDGVLRTITTSTLSTGSSPLLMGAGSTDPVQLFPGTLADVAFYPYPLSAQQVGSHYSGH